MTTKFLVGDMGFDGEYGDLLGFCNLKLVDSEEEAILEVQKRMTVKVIYREPPKFDTRHHTRDNFFKYYPGTGCEIIVYSNACYFPMNSDGSFREPQSEFDFSENSMTKTEYGGFVLGAKPVYEEDSRGSHWNSKILRYEFS